MKNFNRTVNFNKFHETDKLTGSPADVSVASQRHTNTLHIYDSRKSHTPIKKQIGLLDTRKVEKNRVRIERINNVLESQFEK